MLFNVLFSHFLLKIPFLLLIVVLHSFAVIEIPLSHFLYSFFQWIHLFTTLMFPLPSILGYRIRIEPKLDWGAEEKSVSYGKSGN